MNLTHHVGFGDVVKYGLGKLGIKQKPGCGCEKRQAWLNAMTPGYRAPRSGSTVEAYGRDLLSLPDRSYKTGRVRATGMNPRVSYRGHATRPVYPFSSYPLPISGGAPCFSTSNGTVADTQAKIDSAPNGETVCLPVGSFSWAAALTITKNIQLQGAGKANTVITDNLNPGTLIQATEKSTGLIWIRDIGFKSGAGPATSTPDFFIRVSLGGGQPVIVSDCDFNMEVGSGGNGLGWDSNKGVAARNTFHALPGGFNCLNSNSAVRHKPIGLEDSWFTPSTYGTRDTDGLQNFYFEDNVVSNVFEAIDCSDNGRNVVRYNTFLNAHVGGHGADTSYYGCRHQDVYNNSHTTDVGAHQYLCERSNIDPTLVLKYANPTSLVGNRGGVMLIHDNPRIDDIPLNGNWGVRKTGVRFDIEQLRRRDGPYACWGSPGETTQSYPLPHQIGWGYITGSVQPQEDAVGDTWHNGATYPAGSTPPFRPVRQDLEPTRFWNNSGAGGFKTTDLPAVPNYECNISSSKSCASADGSNATCLTRPATGHYYQFGREIVLSDPANGTSGMLPGYQPYPHPHPLLGGTPPPTPPAAPTGLRVL